MKNGDVLLLENTRFHKEEEKNDPAFVEKLAKLGDIYVNDAFSAAHRAHASTEGLAHKLPAYAGRTMQAELEALGKALDAPQRPVIAIVGGAKVSTKLDLLENLITKVAGAGDRRRDGEHVPARAGRQRAASRSPRRTWPTPRGASSPRPRTRAARSSCRWTRSWRFTSRPTRPRTPTASTRSRPTAWCSTSARSRSSASRARSTTPRRWSGTGRSARSR